MELRKRLWIATISLILAAMLAGCVTISPGFRPYTPTPQSPQEFVSKLIAALVSRDAASLEAMMSDPFVLAEWQGEAQALAPATARDEILRLLIDPAQSITFVSNDVVNGWLGGVDPLTLWPPEVKVVDAIGVSITHVAGADEAILVIAEEANGALRWYALLLAPGGFASRSGVAAPIIVAPAPPLQQMLPTDITQVLVLGTVGIFDGPGAAFRQIGLAKRGETYAVRGVSADGQWWAITCDLGANPCWLGANPTFVRPVSQPPTPANTPRPPATSTPRPTPTPTFPIRIDFGPGQSSTVVRGPIGPGQAPQYVLFAGQGQTLRILVTSPSPTTHFAVRGVSDGVLYKSAQDPLREWAIVLPRSQDYLITLSTAVNTSFVMEVTIPPLSPTATPTTLPPVAPERINFAPGEANAVRSNALPASQFKQYVFQARAGQQALILLNSPGSQANFAVQGVSDGVTYKPFSNPAREFSFVLPRTQDYLISLNGPAFLNYTLELTVPPAGPTPPPTATPTTAPVTPERITFPPGATSAVRSGPLWAHPPRAFVFGAAAGQTAHILFGSPSPAAAFAVRGVSDGVEYKAFSDPAREWSFVLPTTQDYVITLQAPVNTSFTLELTIPPGGLPTPAPPTPAPPTSTPLPTATATATLSPPATATHTPTATATVTPAPTATETPTLPPTATLEPTATEMPTETPTVTPTETPTETSETP